MNDSKSVFGLAFLFVAIFVIVVNVVGYGLHALLGWDPHSVIETVYIIVMLTQAEALLKRDPKDRKAKITLGEGGFYESYEHKWACPYPECTFKVSASMKEILDPMVRNHQGLHEFPRQKGAW